MQLSARLKFPGLRCYVNLLISGFTVFMVVSRLISGVHWLTDIIGGILLSAGLVGLYEAFALPENSK
jgi:undecaprenyl-diphosphatase